jgi:hypothetical protein
MADSEVEVREDLVKELLSAMNLTEILTRPDTGGHSGLMEMLVGRIDGLKVHIQFDEHPPPHFSVRCSEGVARFRLDNGDRLAPDRHLRRYDRDIRKWFHKNQRELITEWNNSRPTDCTVGPVPLPK